MKKPPGKASEPGGVLLQAGDEFLDTGKAAQFLGRSPKTLEYGVW